MRFYSDYCKYLNIVFLTLRNSLSLSINYNHTNVQNTYFILLRINMYFNIYLTDNLVLILSIIISSLILLVIKLNFPVKN